MDELVKETKFAMPTIEKKEGKRNDVNITSDNLATSLPRLSPVSVSHSFTSSL